MASSLLFELRWWSIGWCHWLIIVVIVVVVVFVVLVGDTAASLRISHIT